METDSDYNVEPSVLSAVKSWQAKVKRARLHWKDDFDRMQANMKFASGLQWTGQSSLDDERYVCNITLKEINQKVATLYARDPEVEAMRRKRLDFVLWDGKMESVTDALQRALMGREAGFPDMEAEAVLQDFQHGRAFQQMIEKVGRTLEIIYQHQVDASHPEFKEQMKQLVRRVITCGVGYVRPHFVRQGETPLSTVESPASLVDRAKEASRLLNDIMEKGTEDADERVETLKSLVLSMEVTSQQGEIELEERLEFDFPPATSIIPDEGCRSLKDFINARFVVQEYIMSVDEVNAMFGTEIKMSSKIVEYDKVNQPTEVPNTGEQEGKTPPRVAVWEVMDRPTCTHFFIADGHCNYLRPPEPFEQEISGFWPLFALTFNDVEAEPGAQTSIFPPSDVDLVKHPQKEWNRTRDALRHQRNANAPKYIYHKGKVDEKDVRAIADAEPNAAVGLESLPADAKLQDAIAVFQVARIDPAVYDTTPLEQDIMLGGGSQQANLGPAQPNVTATVGTIAEQSRLTVSASNIDDLDGLLSRLASACKDILMSPNGMSVQTVQRIAGPGAVWPMDNRSEFLNQILLVVKAASSGRPNKAIGIANYEKIAPFLLQAGANPLAIIEEGIKRLDDQLEIDRFFPLPGMQLQAMPGAQQSPQTPMPQGPEITNQFPAMAAA